MTADERKKLIAQYNDGYRVVAEALAGATDEQLDARPAPGKWSAREVVHHLADSEMTAATRLRLLIATDNPQIFGYDQEAVRADGCTTTGRSRRRSMRSRRRAGPPARSWSG